MNQFRHVIKKSCIQYFKESMTSTRKSNDIFTIDGLEQIPISSFRFVDFIVLWPHGDMKSFFGSQQTTIDLFMSPTLQFIKLSI